MITETGADPELFATLLQHPLSLASSPTFFDFALHVPSSSHRSLLRCPRQHFPPLVSVVTFLVVVVFVISEMAPVENPHLVAAAPPQPPAPPSSPPILSSCGGHRVRTSSAWLSHKKKLCSLSSCAASPYGHPGCRFFPIFQSYAVNRPCPDRSCVR